MELDRENTETRSNVCKVSIDKGSSDKMLSCLSWSVCGGEGGGFTGCEVHRCDRLWPKNWILGSREERDRFGHDKTKWRWRYMVIYGYSHLLAII